MKPPPCECPARKFPHRRDKLCEDYADEDALRDQELDQIADDPRHGQADGINRERVIR